MKCKCGNPINTLKDGFIIHGPQPEWYQRYDVICEKCKDKIPPNWLGSVVCLDWIEWVSSK